MNFTTYVKCLRHLLRCHLKPVNLSCRLLILILQLCVNGFTDIYYSFIINLVQGKFHCIWLLMIPSDHQLCQSVALTRSFLSSSTASLVVIADCEGTALEFTRITQHTLLVITHEFYDDKSYYSWSHFTYIHTQHSFKRLPENASVTRP